MIALWDTEEKNTLRIDLWTKDMMVDEMKQFYHQNLLSMADTFERATGEVEAAKAMRNFAQEFGERLNLLFVFCRPFAQRIQCVFDMFIRLQVCVGIDDLAVGSDDVGSAVRILR